MVGEEAGRLDQEAGRGRAGLIVQDLAEGNPGAVIDRRVGSTRATGGGRRRAGLAGRPASARSTCGPA
jgi:hypothetical protein